MAPLFYRHSTFDLAPFHLRLSVHCYAPQVPNPVEIPTKVSGFLEEKVPSLLFASPEAPKVSLTPLPLSLLSPLLILTPQSVEHSYNISNPRVVIKSAPLPRNLSVTARRTYRFNRREDVC